MNGVLCAWMGTAISDGRIFFNSPGKAVQPVENSGFFFLRLSASPRSVGFECSTRVKKKRKILQFCYPLFLSLNATTGIV